MSAGFRISAYQISWGPKKGCLEEKFLGSVNRGNSKTQTILPGGFIGLFQESPSSVAAVTHCTITDCD